MMRLLFSLGCNVLDELVRNPLPGETLSSGDEVKDDIPCRLQNISLGGAEIRCSNGWGGANELGTTAGLQ